MAGFNKKASYQIHVLWGKIVTSLAKNIKDLKFDGKPTEEIHMGDTYISFKFVGKSFELILREKK